jgi:hypothetical protein
LARLGVNCSERLRGSGLGGSEAGERLERLTGEEAKRLKGDPTAADVMSFLCITLQAAGQIEPGQRLAQRFHEVDPLSPLSGAMLCCGKWFAGNIGRYVEKIEEALVMDPQNAILTRALGYTYAMMGRIADAGTRAE